MRCPHCGTESNQKVRETRPSPDGRIRRRRRCLTCLQDFHTTEQLSEAGLLVRKTNGTVVPFKRQAVRDSITKAVVHPYPTPELDRLVDAVQEQVYRRSGSSPVSTDEIGQIVLDQLRELDPASHIRFALVQLGRQDRNDERGGWASVAEVRRWLVANYPNLEYHRAPGGLSVVVKRDGRREAFDRRKLERSIGTASKGRGSRDDVWQLAVEVAAGVERLLGDQSAVTSGQLSAEILRILRAWDHGAYLRYASTAKGFTRPEDYEDEALPLRNVPAKRPPSRARGKPAD